MSRGEDDCPPHPDPTPSGKVYCFSAKHHRRDDSDDAQWSPDLSRVEEFMVFEMADDRVLADDHGNLYGLRLGESDRVMELGTRGQQVACFPFTRPNQPWHGYPLWPLLGERGRSNRKSQRILPPKSVFDKMETEGVLEPRDRKRIQKGKHT